MAEDYRPRRQQAPQRPVSGGTQYARQTVRPQRYDGSFDRAYPVAYSDAPQRKPSAPSVKKLAAGKTSSASGKKSATAKKPLSEAEKKRRAAQRRKKERRRKRRKVLNGLLVVLGLLLLLYAGLCWMPWRALLPGSPMDSFQSFFIRNSRESHSFLWVQYFFPDYVREPYVEAERQSRLAQASFNSNLNPAGIQPAPPADGQPIISDYIFDQIPAERVKQMSAEQLAFYETFYQLDFSSSEAYFAAHPETLANGYGRISINEAGLNDTGTSICTTTGEQVLAIDAENGILLIRITGQNYRGVLAITKESSRLHLYTSKGLAAQASDGGYGQTAGEIANAHNGILAISASGFLDENGVGTGGAMVGFCRSDGVDHGAHRYWGSKRLELREDGWLYITEAQSDCRADVTNAMEFEPALVVDGQRLESYVYTADNPRACVGQTDKGEILMLVIEGRLSDSAGCSVGECTNVLQRYRAITAMNMDGGTSAMLWYDGEPVIRCSNQNTPEGRFLPNAWVYIRKDAP